MKNIFTTYSSKTLGGMLISIALSILLFFVIGISYFYIYLPSSTNHGETITVPNIEGMHVNELAEFLVARNLRYEISDSAYSQDHPALTILKQYPAAGSIVKENRNIFISINRVTPPTVPLPDLVDGSLINADAVLRGNELKRGKILFLSGPFLNLVKEMRYQGKKIEPGTRLPKGSVIDLAVEDGGSSEIEAPNVVGYSLDEATFTIYGYSLQVGEIHVVGDTVNNGPVVILKQMPNAKSILRAGDAIEVWVGKEGTEVTDEETDNN
jgi:eukaryotic-like serine/threonine-protein kinase